MTASVGGPIPLHASTNGLPPVYATSGLAHGIIDGLTIHGGLHAAPLAFGVVVVDAGVAARAWRQHDVLPELTLGAGALLTTDFFSLSTSRLYPEATWAASWTIDSTVVYTAGRATLQPSNGAVFVTPSLGATTPLSDILTLQVEAVWQAANRDLRRGLFEGMSSIGGSGALAVYLGATVAL